MDLLHANMIIINSKTDWHLRLRNNIYSLMEYRRSEADLCWYCASKTFLNFQQTRESDYFCLWIKYWVEYLRTVMSSNIDEYFYLHDIKLLFWLTCVGRACIPFVCSRCSACAPDSGMDPSCQKRRGRCEWEWGKLPLECLKSLNHFSEILIHSESGKVVLYLMFKHLILREMWILFD